MDDRKKTLAAVSIILGVIILFIVVIGTLIARKNVVSPVPEEPAIKIIFITPTPSVPATSPTPSGTPRPTARPTSVPKATTVPTKATTPAATPTGGAATPTRSTTPSPTP